MCTQQRCSHCNSLTRKQIIQQHNSRWDVYHQGPHKNTQLPPLFLFQVKNVGIRLLTEPQVTSCQVTDEQGDISESDTQQQQHFPIFAIFFCGWVTPDVCAKQQQYRENVLIHAKTKKHQTSCKTLLEKTVLQLNSLKHHNRFIGKNLETFCACCVFECFIAFGCISLIHEIQSVWVVKHKTIQNLCFHCNRNLNWRHSNILAVMLFIRAPIRSINDGCFITTSRMETSLFVPN